MAPHLLLEEVDASWVLSVRPDVLHFGVRDGYLRCWTFSMPELDWQIFNIMSPIGYGLFLLRPYQAFYDAAWSYIRPDDQAVSNERLIIFKKMLRRLRIPIKSDLARNFFGYFPQFWGDMFHSRGSYTTQLAHRLLTIGVPLRSAERTWRHLLRQVSEFGDRTLAPANEEVQLYNKGPDDLQTDHGSLVLLNSRQMSSERRLEVVNQLRRLLHDEREISALAASMQLGAKFIGAFCPWSRYESGSPNPHDAFEIALLRAEVACRLRWPHTLEMLKASTCTDDPWGYGATIVDRVERELRTFRCIWENPLALD